MNNNPIEAQSTQPPKKNNFLIISIIILLLVIAFGIFWFMNNSNKTKNIDANLVSTQLKTYSFKGENETLSITPPLHIQDLSIKDPIQYNTVKESLVLDNNVLLLVDYSKTEKFVFKQGKTVFYYIDQFGGTTGTAQESRDKLFEIYQTAINKTTGQKMFTDVYEKTTVNNYPAIKHLFAKADNNTSNIVEYFIFGEKDSFSIIQTFSDGLLPEADFEKILSTVKITKN